MTKMTRFRGPLALALGLTAAVVLASCSQTDSPAATAATATTATTSATTGHAAAGHPTTGAATTSPGSRPPAASAGRRVDITVKGKQVTPSPHSIPIKVGETLTIAVTSDHDDQLHAHGFEIEKDIKAGQPLVFTVKGANTGLFEVELHHPALRILQIAVG
jgi:hypothetical protein